jgi:hypothetical protein
MLLPLELRREAAVEHDGRGGESVGERRERHRTSLRHGFAGDGSGQKRSMTIPGGAGSESAGSQQQTHVRDDDDPGLPAATGNVAAGGAPTGDPATGGPISDAVRDQVPEGVGSAGDASSTGEGGSTAGEGGSTGDRRETGDALGAEDPSGI